MILGFRCPIEMDMLTLSVNKQFYSFLDGIDVKEQEVVDPNLNVPSQKKSLVYLRDSHQEISISLEGNEVPQNLKIGSFG